jgi:hypothetical protein
MIGGQLLLALRDLLIPLAALTVVSVAVAAHAAPAKALLALLALLHAARVSVALTLRHDALASTEATAAHSTANSHARREHRNRQNECEHSCTGDLSVPATHRSVRRDRRRIRRSNRRRNRSGRFRDGRSGLRHLDIRSGGRLNRQVLAQRLGGSVVVTVLAHCNTSF